MPRRRFAAVYLAWIAFCALLFFALDGLEDPSRPKGRILSIHAAHLARNYARSHGWPNHEVVHVARARAGEGAPEDRWVVLLDEVPHTRLERAVVVELGVEEGRVVRVRGPER